MHIAESEVTYMSASQICALRPDLKQQQVQFNLALTDGHDLGLKDIEKLFTVTTNRCLRILAIDTTKLTAQVGSILSSISMFYHSHLPFPSSSFLLLHSPFSYSSFHNLFFFVFSVSVSKR